MEALLDVLCRDVCTKHVDMSKKMYSRAKRARQRLLLYPMEKKNNEARILNMTGSLGRFRGDIQLV